jgi:hypothetical protein
MNLRRFESPRNAARIAVLSADQAPTAIIGCPNMTTPDNVARKQRLRQSVRALRLYCSNRRVLSELKGVACGSFRIEIVGSETPLQSRLEEDVFAEVAATNMAIVKAMGLLASVATDRRPYLSRILEAGLLDFEQIDYPNIPKRRRAAFRRKVKVRYASLLRAIP